jgi:hypothetical protein
MENMWDVRYSEEGFVYGTKPVVRTVLTCFIQQKKSTLISLSY